MCLGHGITGKEDDKEPCEPCQSGKSFLFQEQLCKDCLEALDGVGIAGCGRVGMVIGVHLSFGSIGNG